MRRVFADSGYWIALLNPRDELNQRAQEVSSGLGPVVIVTTDFVLAEVLNYFAMRGPQLRGAAVDLVREVRSNANVSITPMSARLFEDGLSLYSKRPDKSCGLTDCSSFVVMRGAAIQEALAHDEDFEHEGFVALLRDRKDQV